MPINDSFKEQVRRNMVALISLAVAISSLGYNTWRNEKSEENRTQRAVAIETLLKLGELQELVLQNYYGRDTADKGDVKTGWALVVTVRDITQVLYDPLPESSGDLFETWSSHAKTLNTSEDSKIAIEESIESLRADILTMLEALD